MMTGRSIKIVSRKSMLAIWQAEFVKNKLTSSNKYNKEKINIEIIPISTKADRFVNQPLYKIGGKSLFVKELEEYLLTGKADLAVHSMKDVGVDLPDELLLSAILKRDNPYDAFVSNKYNSISELPAGAKIGTSSLRRSSQILALKEDIKIQPLRGNVDTRLDKLDKGYYDAIILATAGLKRLNFSDRIKYIFNEEEVLPAIGQGAIGVECRARDHELQELLNNISDLDTTICVSAEREINRILNGSCQSPIAAFATIIDGTLSLTGLVADLAGRDILKSQGEITQVDFGKAIMLGEKIGNNLIENGAYRIIEKCKQTNS